MTTPRAASTAALRILHSGDGISVAQAGPICIVLWRDAVVKHRFDRQAQGLAGVVEGHRGEAGFLCVIEPSAKPPDDKLRQASIDMILRHGSDLKCAACVIEGSGFRAAVGRSVLAGMTLLAGKRKTPTSFFSTVDAAERWIRHYTACASFDLTACVQQMKITLEP